MGFAAAARARAAAASPRRGCTAPSPAVTADSLWSMSITEPPGPKRSECSISSWRCAASGCSVCTHRFLFELATRRRTATASSTAASAAACSNPPSSSGRSASSPCQASLSPAQAWRTMLTRRPSHAEPRHHGDHLLSTAWPDSSPRNRAVNRCPYGHRWRRAARRALPPAVVGPLRHVGARASPSPMTLQSHSVAGPYGRRS